MQRRERRAVDGAGVGVDPAGHVDGDGSPRRPRGRGPAPAASARSPPRPPMPTIPSRTRSARPRPSAPPANRRQHPAAGAPERGEAGRVHPVGIEQDGGDPRAPAGEGGAGEQRVAAVVAGADEQRDATSVGRAEQPQADGGQAGGGPLHERALGLGGEQRRLGGPHLRAVCSPITRRPAMLRGRRRSRDGEPSATTTAEAMPPSWLSEMCQEVTPSCAARPATVPRTSRCGRPCSPTVTSASCQCRSPGAPRALASASLAANRAARDSPVRAAPEGVCCSASVNSRSRSPGVRGSDSAKRSTGTTSIPTPMITGSVCRARARCAARPPARPTARRERLASGSLDRDGLGQVPRLVDVQTPGVGDLAGQHLQRDRW